MAVRQASMSRSDSRQVSCAKAMTRNKSSQPKVRTPASPWYRSTMRPKVFHGTNSITCANSVLPTFMRHPGVGQTREHRKTAKRQIEIQIADTHESLETRVNACAAARWLEINRTLVAFSSFILTNQFNRISYLNLSSSSGRLLDAYYLDFALLFANPGAPGTNVFTDPVSVEVFHDSGRCPAS